MKLNNRMEQITEEGKLDRLHELLLFLQCTSTKASYFHFIFKLSFICLANKIESGFLSVARRLWFGKIIVTAVLVYKQWAHTHPIGRENISV